MSTLSIPGACLGVLLLSLSNCDRDPPPKPGLVGPERTLKSVSINGVEVQRETSVTPPKKAPK